MLPSGGSQRASRLLRAAGGTKSAVDLLLPSGGSQDLPPDSTPRGAGLDSADVQQGESVELKAVLEASKRHRGQSSAACCGLEHVSSTKVSLVWS